MASRGADRAARRRRQRDRGGPAPALRHLAAALHAVHGAARRHRQLGRSRLGLRRATTGARISSTSSRDLAPGRHALRRTLQPLLPLARRRRARRRAGPAMRNYVWGGKETNRVGTHEFVDFCRRVGRRAALLRQFSERRREALSHDAGGQPHRRCAARPPTGSPMPTIRTIANARATAPPQPYNIKLWQLGNETSYGNATFTQRRIHRRIRSSSRAP